MKVEDLDLIEANEAFAWQSLSQLPRDPNFNSDILNVNGGAIGPGHPVEPGCRILTTLLYEMQKRDAKKVLQHSVSAAAWDVPQSSRETKQLE